VGEDGTSSGWMSSDGSTLGPCVGKYAADWRTVDYRAGDVVALSIDLFHMSAANCTDCIRVSCDTRWQPVRRPAYSLAAATSRFSNLDVVDENERGTLVD